MSAEIEHNGKDIPELDPKDPDDQDYFGFNYNDELEAGEVITSSTWGFPNLEQGRDEANELVPDTFQDGKTNILIRTGSAQNRYRLTNTIKTNYYRKLSRSLEFVVKDL